MWVSMLIEKTLAIFWEHIMWHMSALRSSCIPDDRKLAGRVCKQTKQTNTFQRQVN